MPMLNHYFFKTHRIRKAVFLFLFIFSMSSLSYSQINRQFIEKYSPLLMKDPSRLLFNREDSFVITVSEITSFREFIAKTPGIYTIAEYLPIKTFLIRARAKDINEKILIRSEVLFVDVQRVAKEEVAVSNLDNSANKVNLLHARYPQYNGTGLHVSVKENRPDTLDIDLKGRYTATNSVSPTLSSHATIMSTIIAGAGNSYYEGRGVANAAGINSTTFAVLMPETDNFYQQYNVSVQNHSYGTGIENYYGADAAAYDATVITRPSLVHVFSAGNSGTATSAAGAYTGIPGFANTTGSFKMAKNIITVGHSDSLGIVLAPSSKGPAFDGRVKPELVAFGEDGSSGAAAIVSGIALSLQHAFKEINGTLPTAALVKAILLNSADDRGAKNIDFSSGYGAVNAIKAMRGLVNGQYINGTISQGATTTIPFNVPPNIKQLKITMTWTDPAATVNTTKSLVNDADLELLLPATNETWRPWVLSHFPHIDSLQKLAARKRDSLNTVEQISIDNPVPGNYSILVKGFSITAGAQSYSIAYSFDTLDRFEWQYPAGTDNIFGGQSNTLRWENSWATVNGSLEYSINNGVDWQLISNAADLGKGYYKWNAPDTFVTARLRMNTGSQLYLSDEFTISKRMNTYVGFDCPDSFLFYWNKQPGVGSYRVDRLGARYMEPIRVTTDTMVVLSKQSNPSLYYAVVPLLNNKPGVRSYGFDYSNQGVGCYVKSFVVMLNGNAGNLQLELGTLYRVRSISWEKLSAGTYRNLQTVNPVSGLLLSYTDNTLVSGINTYRVKIELENGQIVYSQPESINYFANLPYIVYPNPAVQGQPVNILLKEPEPTVVTVFNSIGAKLREINVNDITTTIPANSLSKGSYFLQFRSAGQAPVVLKLVVY
jgi:hypothetical protein